MPPRKRKEDTSEPIAIPEPVPVIVGDDATGPHETVPERRPERPQRTVDAPADPGVTVEEMTELETAEAEMTWERINEVIAEDRTGKLQRRLSALAVPQPGAIFAAIWAIMRDVRGVGKHGTMDPKAGGYSFRKYDDLKLAVSAACREHGVMLQSRIFDVINEPRGNMQRVQVHITYRFTSLVDGSEVLFDSIGESIDRSDKASGKAMTMALKTALDQALVLASVDIEDPDAVRPEPDEIPREQRQARRDQSQARHYREDEPPPPGGHQVGDTREVAGVTFTKHSDGYMRPPGYPNDQPKDPADPWDQGPVEDRRTPDEKAQAAADKVSQPGITMQRWTAISDAARSMELMEIPIKTPDGQTLPLKHYLVAVSRTL